MLGLNRYFRFINGGGLFVVFFLFGRDGGRSRCLLDGYRLFFLFPLGQVRCFLCGRRCWWVIGASGSSSQSSSTVQTLSGLSGCDESGCPELRHVRNELLAQEMSGRLLLNLDGHRLAAVLQQGVNEILPMRWNSMPTSLSGASVPALSKSKIRAQRLNLKRVTLFDGFALPALPARRSHQDPNAVSVPDRTEGSEPTPGSLSNRIRPVRLFSAGSKWRWRMRSLY